MKFKDLEWKDIVSDNVIVSSHCIINLCGVLPVCIWKGKYKKVTA